MTDSVEIVGWKIELDENVVDVKSTDVVQI